MLLKHIENDMTKPRHHPARVYDHYRWKDHREARRRSRCGGELKRWTRIYVHMESVGPEAAGMGSYEVAAEGLDFEYL